jgi:hypothetical protein
VNIRIDDGSGSDTKDLVIAVRYVSVTACDDWTLTVTGNVITAAAAICG